MGHRAAIYCRVSTADQSCERQEFDLRAFAGRAGYDVVGIFKETGSGTKLDRAERKKVLALAQSRQIDAILVTELSRWGRSTLDLLNTLRELEGTVAKLAMRQPFVLFKGLTFQKLCLPGAFRPGDHHNK
ncbi:recombinase family protein, partial [Escherichia coli]|uniref:recombinase family protein n=6 Tax=Enterobacterales TaxID=91347 RepID=UPI0020794ED0